eukprot:9501506-Pyramimonas_sp.AAC.1
MRQVRPLVQLRLFSTARSHLLTQLLIRASQPQQCRLARWISVALIWAPLAKTAKPIIFNAQFAGFAAASEPAGFLFASNTGRVHRASNLARRSATCPGACARRTVASCEQCSPTSRPRASSVV